MKRSLLFAAGAILMSVGAYAQKPLQWQPLREPGSGGWITSFRISPHDGKRMILGGDMLGSGLSTDGGQNWGPVFGYSSWEINDFSFHPTNANIVWSGTLMGPYKSSDGGRNFIEKRKGFPPRAGFGYSAPVERVLFDPNDANHLIAFGGSSRGWDLPGQKPLWGAVWESNDGGESWAKIATIGADGNTVEAEKGVNIYSAEFAAGSSTTLYAASPWAGFFVSSDGGKTWTKRMTGLPHKAASRVQVHPREAKTLWLSLGHAKVGEKSLPGGVFKSTDGGQSWQALNSGLSQKSDDKEINFTASYWPFAVAPSNPDVMYTADGAWNSGVIYVSRDGGKTWRATATKQNVGHDQSAELKGASQVDTAMPAGLAGTYFAVDPKNENVAFNVGSEHIIATRDGGKTWRDEGNDKQADGGWQGRGFTGWCSWNARYNPYKRGQIALNALDAARVYLSHDGGTSWHRHLNDPSPWGGGVDTAFTRAGHIYATTGQHGAFQGIGRSTDGGKTWQVLHGAKYGLPEGGWGKGNAEPAGIFALPDEPKKVWASIGDKLYRSTDGGEKWSVADIGPGPKWIAGDPKNSEAFFVSGAKNVYSTTDGGETWKAIGGPRKAGRMAVDSLGRLYICADEGDLGGLWRWDGTLAADKKWTRLWDDRWVMNVAVDPTNPNRVAFTTNQNPYVETSQASGVWISSDAGQTWTQANDNLPMLRGHAIAFNPFDSEEMIHGTLGRGYFKTRWPQNLAVTGGKTYRQTAADINFARAVEGAQIAFLKNGDMSAGGAIPEFWTEKWNDVQAFRDTQTFKEGPASLRVEASGKSGSAFQMFEVPGGTSVKLSGWFKTQGTAKAQVALQAFSDDWKQNDWQQIAFQATDSDWAHFEKTLTIPDWAALFNVQVNLDGRGKAWLDEVQMVATAPQKAAVATNSTTEITRVIRDFGPASFDYPFGGWKAEMIKPGDTFVTLDANEAGGAGLVLNGADIAPQQQTHLTLRAKLLPGNGAMQLNVNLKGPEKSVSFDLTKLNANEFTTLTAPLPEGGKYNNVQQLQIQGTNWSAAAQPLKIQIDSIGTTSPGAVQPPNNPTASQPTSSAPAKDKPAIAAWGFWPNFPQAWMQTHNGFVQRTKQGAAKQDINVIFFGDSITQGWGGDGKDVWDKTYAPLGAVNYGIGGDTTRQVLWRILNGEVEGLNPKLVVLKIGTNNLYNDLNSGSDEEIADGITKIVSTLREKLPNTKILLLGVLPRQNDYFSGRAKRINEIIKKLDNGQTVRFLDMSDKFQTELGKVKPELYVPDQLHLAKPGYELWAATMKPLFDEMRK